MCGWPSSAADARSSTDSISVVRPLREGVIRDFQLCEAMLRYFMRKAQRNNWGLPPRVVITVPGCVTPVEKRAVFNSALRAGAKGLFAAGEQGSCHRCWTAHRRTRRKHGL